MQVQLSLLFEVEQWLPLGGAGMETKGHKMFYCLMGSWSHRQVQFVVVPMNTLDVCTFYKLALFQ